MKLTEPRRQKAEGRISGSRRSMHGYILTCSAGFSAEGNMSASAVRPCGEAHGSSLQGFEPTPCDPGFSPMTARLDLFKFAKSS